MDDCVVCLNATSTLAKPCNHVICVHCATLWLKKNPTCPVCRGIIIALHPSLVPFPEVRQRSFSCTPVRTCTRKINFECTGQHAGITLTNTTHFGSITGVRVLRIHSNDRAAKCGVCVGDIITHINGIRVKSHTDAIRLIQRATDVGAPMELIVANYQYTWPTTMWHCCHTLDC